MVGACSAPHSVSLGAVSLRQPGGLLLHAPPPGPAPLRVGGCLQWPYPAGSHRPVPTRSAGAGTAGAARAERPLSSCLVAPQGSVPPVMAFHLGSLGFLTPFNFENFQSQVTQVIEGESECSGTHKHCPAQGCFLTVFGVF